MESSEAKVKKTLKLVEDLEQKLENAKALFEIQDNAFEIAKVDEGRAASEAAMADVYYYNVFGVAPRSQDALRSFISTLICATFVS